MSHNVTSTGCPAHTVLAADPVAFFSNGNINFKAHDVGWLVSGVFTLIAVVTSFWLIGKHLSFFTSPHVQRHIVRILFLAPLYAVLSCLSYYFYNQALYFQLVRDCYEAIVIAAFFFLLVAYLSNPPPTPEQPCPAPYETRAERAARLREVVKDFHLDRWVWPLGAVKWRPAKGGQGEGESFLWLMRLGIGQYVVVRPLSTLIAVVSHFLGYYCLASWSPGFTHLYTAIAITLSVTIAMYCVVQLYFAFKKELAPFSPVLKFLAVKLVIFAMFWQETLFAGLETFGVIKDKEYWTAGSIVVGLAALCACFEMMCFSFLHVKAFTYLPYRALVKPVRLPADSDTISLASTPSAPVDGSFAEWQKWEERKKRELKAASRLAKMKVKDGRLVKEDGTPLLQQTKRWPALLKCLLLTDLGRELKEETGYMVRRREPGLLDRRDDLEEAMGKPRPMGESEKEWGYEGGAYAYGRGDSLEKDLRRLKEGKPVGLGAKGKVGADGSLLLPTLAKNGRPHHEEDMQRRYSREEEGSSLLRGEEGRLERWEKGVQQRRIKTAVEGKESWWNSLSKGFGHKRQKKAAVSTFQQLERPNDGYHPRPPPSDVDPDPTTSLPAPPRIISHPQTRPSHAPRRPGAPPRPLELNLPPPLALSDDVILDSMAGMGPIVAPHALGSPTRTSAPVARTTNSRRHSADPRLGSSTPSTINSATYTQRAPSFFSPDAAGLRHPSIAASNPPRSLWSPSPAEPPLTDFAPPPRAWRRHSAQVEVQSERSLQLIATEQSRVSRGLPPGAGPRAGGGGGGGARGFVFEEY